MHLLLMDVGYSNLGHLEHNGTMTQYEHSQMFTSEITQIMYIAHRK